MRLAGWLIFPAILFASIIGGGVHGATRTHFTLGLVFELLCVWIVLRIVRRARARRRGTAA